MKTALLAV